MQYIVSLRSHLELKDIFVVILNISLVFFFVFYTFSIFAVSLFVFFPPSFQLLTTSSFMHI